jgi:hypothetical protein
MVVLGGIFVGVLIRPRRPGTARRVAALRAAGSSDAVLELAYARAAASLAPPVGVVRSPDSATKPPITLWGPRVWRAGGFALIGTGLGATAHRIAERAWPPLWVVAISFAVLAGIGLLAYARARLAWQWALLVTGTQLLLNAAFTAVTLFLSGHGAGTASWARLLFCYHVGSGPTAAQVSAARRALGANAVKLFPAATSTGSAQGLLIWAAVAHFAAAVAAGLYVVYGESAVRSLRGRAAQDVGPVLDVRQLEYVG